MTTASDIEWHMYSPLPVPVRLQYIMPDGKHPLTPEAIRERYDKEVSDSSLVIWRSNAVGRTGFRAGIDELTWELSRIVSVEFTFCQPGKGSGSVLLCVDGRLAVLSARFDTALLDWFRPIVTVLTDMFPGKVTQQRR